MEREPPRAEAQSSLSDVVRSNIDAITHIEQAAHASRSRGDVVADAIAAFCGSTLFVYVHVLLFGVWLLWNTLFAERFDPPPFNMLTLVVSLEAIFLSTFILISQNRQQRTADQRNHLDLQINLLAEQENSQMLRMLTQIMEQLKIPLDKEKADVLLEETDPVLVAEQIQETLENGEAIQDAKS